MPGKPDAPEITKSSRTSVSLKWTPPAKDGGAEITNYVVEQRAEGAFKWSKATEDKVWHTHCTVQGLRPDSIYEFRVAAQNRAGVGPASELSQPIRAQSPVGKSEDSFVTVSSVRVRVRVRDLKQSEQNSSRA